MTNADRIRVMSTEELARWLVYARANVRAKGNRTIGEPAVKAALEWLKEEVEVDKMTAQEAIKLLHPDTTKEAIAEIKYYCGFHGKEAAIKAIEDACLLACDALEKQVPKKAIDIQTPVVAWGLCPKCKGELNKLGGKPNRIFEGTNFCSDCGQAIDWTKEEG